MTLHRDLFIGFLFFMVTNICVYAQNKKELCLCFDDQTKNIRVLFNKDSTFTHFIIEKKMENKNENKNIYKKDRIVIEDDPQPPRLKKIEYGAKRPIKTELSPDYGCTGITIDEFRDNFKRLKKHFDISKIKFIKHNRDGTYLMWEGKTPERE